MASLVAEATAACSGQEEGTLLVVDSLLWPGWVRADWGEGRTVRVADIRPGQGSDPSGDARVFDLVALESSLMGAAIDAVTASDEALHGEARTGLASYKGISQNDYIGLGWQSLDSLACSLINTARRTLQLNGERPRLAQTAPPTAAPVPARPVARGGAGG